MSRGEFEFGPIKRINLRLEGEALSNYGRYDELPKNIQDALQLLCHAIVQISEDVKRSKAGVFFINNRFVIININNIYCVNNIDNGMAIMNLTKENEYDYSTDFFSVKQLLLTDPILSYAYNDTFVNGRRG